MRANFTSLAIAALFTATSAAKELEAYLQKVFEDCGPDGGETVTYLGLNKCYEDLKRDIDVSSGLDLELEFYSLDFNGDGVIDKDEKAAIERVLAYTPTAGLSEEEQVASEFNFADADSSGAISLAEAKAVWSLFLQDVPRENLEKRFMLMDTDKSGEVTLEEF